MSSPIIPENVSNIRDIDTSNQVDIAVQELLSSNIDKKRSIEQENVEDDSQKKQKLDVDSASTPIDETLVPGQQHNESIEPEQSLNELFQESSSTQSELFKESNPTETEIFKEPNSTQPELFKESNPIEPAESAPIIDNTDSNAQKEQEESNAAKQIEFLDENEQLKLIAEEIEQATTSKKDHITITNETSAPTTQEERDSLLSIIPEDSELLNTNEALKAYTEISQSLPPLSSLTNAHLSAIPLPVVAPDYLPPKHQFLINSLPTLDNLASQLLRIVAIGPYQKILDLVAHPESPAGEAYKNLTQIFDFTRKLYSEDDPFLNVEHIAPGLWIEGSPTPSMFRSREESIESTLRKVNLATFLSAILGTLDVGFFYLDESFLDVFCPANNLNPENSISTLNSSSPLQGGTTTTGTVGKLLKQQAVIYLNLKTQAYISAIEAGERSREEILDDIFPPDLEQIMMMRRGTRILTPAENDFVERCKSRKENLLLTAIDEDLSEKYEWLSFLREVFDYTSKNIGFLIWGKRGRASDNNKEKPKQLRVSPAPIRSSEESSNERTLPEAQHQTIQEPTKTTERVDPISIDEQERQRIDLSHLVPSEILENQLHLQLTSVSTNATGQKIKQLHRRPWSREEEKALRHALELKGPQWSQILELFGAGGKISEALKNRSQVQLKDKARNWKMFFLKSGLEVPSYLSQVTGDLERDDRMKNNSRKRSRKTAAAPIPSLQQDNNTSQNNTNNQSSSIEIDSPSIETNQGAAVENSADNASEVADSAVDPVIQNVSVMDASSGGHNEENEASVDIQNVVMNVMNGNKEQTVDISSS